MTAQLTDLIQEAEAKLGPTDRARLAELVEGFLVTHQGPAPFTDAEMAHLRALDAEPFEPANPSEIAALFARRG